MHSLLIFIQPYKVKYYNYLFTNLVNKWKHKYFKHLAQIMLAFGENKALNPEYLIPEATYIFD